MSPDLAALIVGGTVSPPAEVLEIVDEETPKIAIHRVTAFLLKGICMAISEKLFERCFFPNGKAETFFDFVHVNLMDKVPVPVGTFPSGCKLALAGDVTCSRQKGSVICAAIRVSVEDDGQTHCFPIGFYINGDLYKNLSSDVLVPGWLAKALRFICELPL
jgi:hypothetical protein